MQISGQRRRLRVDTAAGTLTDQQTGRLPALWRNSVTVIDLGFYFGAAWADLTGITAVALKLYAAAPTAGASAALSAADASPTVAPDEADWIALTDEHASLAIDDGATWPAAGTYWWAVEGTLAGGTAVLASGAGLTLADAGPANP